MSGFWSVSNQSFGGERQAGSIYREYIHTTSYRCVAVTGPQRSTRKLYSSKTGRAGGIDAKTWPTELEVVVDFPLFIVSKWSLFNEVPPTGPNARTPPGICSLLEVSLPFFTEGLGCGNGPMCSHVLDITPCISRKRGI